MTSELQAAASTARRRFFRVRKPMPWRWRDSKDSIAKLIRHRNDIDRSLL